eukprot:scaffold116824_cov36-Phaeocystis_antarctica.AAC.3
MAIPTMPRARGGGAFYQYSDILKTNMNLYPASWMNTAAAAVAACQDETDLKRETSRKLKEE